MKDKVKSFSCMLIILTFLFVYEHHVVGQEKFVISTGFGIPELLNIGVRFRHDQFQTGLSIGSMPLVNEKIFSISGDTRYHFGGFSELSDSRPWYGRIGLNYLRDETRSIIDNYLYLNARIGREFNLSHKLGIEADVGASFQLYHKEVRKISSGWNWDLNFPVIPGLVIGLFYRL